MSNLIDLDYEATQTALAGLVGVTQPTISNLVSEGKLPSSGTLGELLLAYCARLRDQAAGRMGENTTLDLVQERAALAREQERPDVARKRERWKARQGSIDPKRLVFIDETWAKTNMAPLRGWAARGQRLIGRAPFGHWMEA